MSVLKQPGESEGVNRVVQTYKGHAGKGLNAGVDRKAYKLDAFVWICGI